MYFNLSFEPGQIKQQTRMLVDMGETGKDFPAVYIDRGSYIVSACLETGANMRGGGICGLHIGRYSALAENIRFLADIDHDIDSVFQGEIEGIKNDSYKHKRKGQIIIGNDCWIGYGAVIIGSVYIGDGAVVAAGAVVTKDVPPYAIVAGNPAKVVRYRFEEEIIDKLMRIRWWECPAEVLATMSEDLKGDVEDFARKYGRMISHKEVADCGSSVAVMGEKVPVYTYIADWKERYCTYKNVIRGFCEAFHNEDAQLVIFIQGESEQERQKGFELIMAELEKYSEYDSLILVIDDPAVDPESVIINSDHVITSRDGNAVDLCSLASLYGKHIIFGTDSPIFDESDHKNKKIIKIQREERAASYINEGQWDKALAEVRDLLSDKPSVKSLIEASELMFRAGEDESALSMLYRALRKDPYDHELYYMLASYLRDRNPDQAYLCYENALFFCDNEGDKEIIKSARNELKQTKEINVKPASIIILAHNNVEETKKCIESIRANCHEDAYRIVVVDNASIDGTAKYLREQADILSIFNEENEGFPRGCNIGARAAEAGNDIFLLNNDTVLLPNSLFNLRMGLYSGNDVAAAGAVTNYAANAQMVTARETSFEACRNLAVNINIPAPDALEDRQWLVGFALLIKRKAWDETGELDERFSPGNFEDTDYGYRIKEAGYRNVLCRNAFVYHHGSVSFGKDNEKYRKLLEDNLVKFNEKWKGKVTLP
ncbi:MAG: glycosyltransferase [Lachnospiraceae bacterium]|nr:glycosyltransferase [Lachnospiraceae bacterium]